MVAHGDIRRRAVREEERHALVPARDEHAVRAEPRAQLMPRSVNLLLRMQFPPERRRKLRIVLLDVADALIGKDVIARVHDARESHPARLLDDETAHALRHCPRAVVREHDAAHLREEFPYACEQSLLRLCRQRRMPLAVDAHNLLADGRPPARDDPRLCNRWMRLCAHESLRVHPIFTEHGEEGVTAVLRAADPHCIRGAADRRRIVCNICRAARDHALLTLLEDEHGCLTRDARNLTVEIDIRYHVSDDEHGCARHLCECIYHGVNSHLTFHESCFER